MSLHRDFAEALAEWQDYGGAMRYHSATSDQSEAWDVVAAVGDDARELTVAALERGGMNAKQITKEMATWQD